MPRLELFLLFLYQANISLMYCNPDRWKVAGESNGCTILNYKIYTNSFRLKIHVLSGVIALSLGNKSGDLAEQKQTPTWASAKTNGL